MGLKIFRGAPAQFFFLNTTMAIWNSKKWNKEQNLLKFVKNMHLDSTFIHVHVGQGRASLISQKVGVPRWKIFLSMPQFRSSFWSAQNCQWTHWEIITPWCQHKLFSSYLQHMYMYMYMFLVHAHAKYMWAKTCTTTHKYPGSQKYWASAGHSLGKT